jgi:hypothetical protein
MPVWSTLKYSFSLLLALSGAASLSSAQTADSTATSRKKPVEMKTGNQLRVTFDISKPIINAAAKNRQSYELGVDYYLKKEVYLVAEGGFGKSDVDYPDLAYKSSGSFVRLGVDKGMLQRLFPKDWDGAFVGVRYGLGIIKRGEATYVINDPLFGNTSGIVEAQNFTAHWAEITGGVRVELIRNFMVGWNVRAKFMLNASAFSQLAPAYIAGYGKGDGSTAFDFNFNLCYMVRWGEKNLQQQIK